MSAFISWFGETVGQWWSFLCATYVPGCQFTFAALFLFVIGVSLVVSIIHYVIGVRLYGSAADYRAAKEMKKK